jgi:hypothetical protein
MAHLFRLSDEAWAAIDRHLPRGKPDKLASTIVASSVEFCMFSRPDAVGATCRPNMVRPPRSTIAITDGRSAGCGQRLFEQIAASGDVPRELSLDSSHVKAHRSADKLYPRSGV